jgi:hypothetical protein
VPCDAVVGIRGCRCTGVIYFRVRVCISFSINASAPGFARVSVGVGVGVCCARSRGGWRVAAVSFVAVVGVVAVVTCLADSQQVVPVLARHGGACESRLDLGQCELAPESVRAHDEDIARAEARSRDFRLSADRWLEGQVA